MRRQRETEDMLMLLAALAHAERYQPPGEVWAEQVADMTLTPVQRRAGRDAEVAAFIRQAGG